MSLKRLTVEHGNLYLDGDVLLYFYRAGDCDAIDWPDYNPDHLRGALYDEYETGAITGERAVLLPDGARFLIDP